MKQFFNTFLACLAAIFISSVISTILFISVLVGMIVGAMSSSNMGVSPETVLVVATSEIGGDTRSADPFATFDFNTFQIRPQVTTYDAVKAIRYAAGDDRIKALVIFEDGPMPGFAQTQELREAIAEFKESGKSVYAHGMTYSTRGYYLSSVAHEVALNPEGVMNWMGLSIQQLYFKNMLDKLGIKVNAVKHGKYKSAVEPYTLAGMSEPSRRQYQTLLNSYWNSILSEIAESRNVSVEKLNELANTKPFMDPADAMESQLVDRVCFADEFDDTLRERYGKEFQRLSLARYAPGVVGNESKSRKASEVAIIYLEGEIMEGESGNYIVGDRTMCELLMKAREDKNVKAVVLRVNSPGGSVFAAENICREMELLGKEKTVVASFGNLAASGGYYVATLADLIVASPSTLTGSIGVFSIMLDAESALNNKLGITADVVKTNTYADFGSPLRKGEKNEEVIMQNFVDRMYMTFLKRVSQGRNLTVEQVDGIAQGRVWSGTDSKEIGLVDAIGDMQTAIELAADRAGLGANYRVKTIEEDRGFFFGVSAVASAMFGKKSLPLDAEGMFGRQVDHFMKVAQTTGPQAIMPYMVSVE